MQFKTVFYIVPSFNIIALNNPRIFIGGAEFVAKFFVSYPLILKPRYQLIAMAFIPLIAKKKFGAKR